MLDPESELVFTVTDLKQYTYCPRIVFYAYCLPLLRPKTFKMESGIRAHDEARERERRRTLSVYGLQAGKRHFDLPVASQALGLQGKIDMAIEVADEEEGGGEWIPVDYKQSRRRIGAHVQIQLAAYGLMLEETLGVEVKRGFVYSLLTRKAEEVSLTRTWRRKVREAVESMRVMVEQETMPEPPASHRRCANCEFRRFCNDVV
jgi:CRISPR-associated exonuclease Cas4